MQVCKILQSYHSVPRHVSSSMLYPDTLCLKQCHRPSALGLWHVEPLLRSAYLADNIQHMEKFQVCLLRAWAACSCIHFIINGWLQAALPRCSFQKLAIIACLSQTLAFSTYGLDPLYIYRPATRNPAVLLYKIQCTWCVRCMRTKQHCPTLKADRPESPFIYCTHTQSHW